MLIASFANAEKQTATKDVNAQPAVKSIGYQGSGASS